MNADSAGQGVLRVASYNLRALKDDTWAAVQVVRAIDPDVLLLQEIPRHPLSGLRVSAFARRCGLRWSGRTRALSGTTLMTSYRVQTPGSQDRTLPVGLTQNPRSYTAARVCRPGGMPFAAVCLHLPLKPRQRVQHVRQVLSELTVDPVLADLPWVLGGDINEQADAPAWGVLAEHLHQVSPQVPTFPATAPRGAIDAIFASPGIESVAATQTPLVLPQQRPALLRAATDHLPVWADLRV